jgi:hypothetical protein
MKLLVISLLTSLGVSLAEPPPLPILHEYHSKEEKVFGLNWLSAGVEYKYTLEVDVDDGLGWFEVATWVNIPMGTSMTGYTYYGAFQPKAIARVRVERVVAPTPRGFLNWKVTKPARF